MPIASLVNRYRPQGVLNVKSSELSSSSGSHQYLLHASKEMKLSGYEIRFPSSSTVIAFVQVHLCEFWGTLLAAELPSRKKDGPRKRKPVRELLIFEHPVFTDERSNLIG